MSTTWNNGQFKGHRGQYDCITTTGKGIRTVKTYVLDACAIIALINQELGHEIIVDLYNQSIDNQINLVLHKINLIEIYYEYSKKIGFAQADWILNNIKSSNININEDLDDIMLKTVAYFKTNYRISLADSFVLATNKILAGTIVTADQEFKSIEKFENLDILWFR